MDMEQESAAARPHSPQETPEPVAAPQSAAKEPRRRRKPLKNPENDPQWNTRMPQTSEGVLWRIRRTASKRRRILWVQTLTTLLIGTVAIGLAALLISKLGFGRMSILDWIVAALLLASGVFGSLYLADLGGMLRSLETEDAVLRWTRKHIKLPSLSRRSPDA